MQFSRADKGPRAGSFSHGGTHPLKLVVYPLPAPIRNRLFSISGGISPLTNVTYQFRRSLIAHAQEYALTESALVWPGGSAALADIQAVRIYSIPGLQMGGIGNIASPSRRCAITLSSGDIIQLSSAHFLSPGRFEDRSPALIQFAAALVARVRAANPGARILSGMSPLLWWSWVLIFGVLALLLILCIALGLIGLTLEHQNTLGTFLLFFALAVLLIGPISFLRATWRRRTRTLDSADISKAI